MHNKLVQTIVTMAVMIEIAILTTLFVTVATSDRHCTSFRRRSLHVGERPTRPSCPGPRSIHTPSGNFNRNVTAPSALMCGLFCMRDDICESFRYCQDQNLCQLNTTLPQEGTMKILRSTGCVLFDKELQEESKEVTEASSTSVLPPCEWTRTTAPREFVKIPSALTAPLRLEFKAETRDHWAYLIFSANNPDNDLYRVGMTLTVSNIEVMKYNGWEDGTKKEDNFMGSVIVITIHEGLITVDVQGSGPSYRYQNPYPPQVTSWYVAFGGGESEIQWDFVDPCNPF